jgi:hypothetical protein
LWPVNLFPCFLYIKAQSVNTFTQAPMEEVSMSLEILSQMACRRSQRLRFHPLTWLCNALFAPAEG